MTARIVGAFIAVLAAVLVAVVVPLGIVVTRQQSQDFRDQLDRAAAAVATVAEEHLDDRAAVTGLRTVLARFAADGYRGVVLDSAGRPIAVAGPGLPAAVVSAAADGHALPGSDDTLAVSAPVGDAGPAAGTVVLARSTSELDRRHADLWTELAAAAGGALAIGAAIAWALSRWISRPLRGLVRVARGVGHDTAAGHADEQAGPSQIREVAVAFNAMSERVEALLRAQRGMTAEVSHQLRTPLAALRLRLELHRDDLSDVGAADDVTAMIDETGRLSRLLDGLLAIARAEAAAPSTGRTDLAAVAADRATVWTPAAADRQVSLDLDAVPAVARTTPGHLEQVLDNLLDNAINATPSGGRITVTVRSADSGAVLTISDTGRGMSAEQRSQALRPWTTDRAGSGGTGLGLAVARRLVEIDHGTLSLADAPGGGLRATIEYSLS